MALQKQIGIYPWHQNEQLTLLKSGEPFFKELLLQINNAQFEIHFHVYIFANDQTGKIIFEALHIAAKRKVQIYLWLDGFGSNGFPSSWEAQLKESGAVVNYFSKYKLTSTFRLGIRMHHKIFIFDCKFALIGGVNISNSYSGYGKGKTWLDFAILIKGNSVIDLLRICVRIEKGFLPLGNDKKRQLKYKEEIGTFKSRILQNHWLKAKFGITRQYRQNIRTAKKEILLLASYFLPSPALKRLIKKAAVRGVKVKLVFGGLSDVGTMKYATQYFYKDLLKSGVEIWEWQPSVLHAKLALIDDEWICIGSYNLNYLSDFGSTECNIEIRNKEFKEACQFEINQLLNEDGLKIDALQFTQKIGWVQSFRNYMAYRTMVISMKLLFFFK
jgi:cardiolipin synthase